MDCCFIGAPYGIDGEDVPVSPVERTDILDERSPVHMHDRNKKSDDAE